VEKENTLPDTAAPAKNPLSDIAPALGISRAFEETCP
jgi:hypothetical protein